MITDKPPIERIWSCLRVILCNVDAAQDTSSEIIEIILDTSRFFWKLSPENGPQFVDDDPVEFEKRIEALENAAASAAADLSEIHRYTRLIRGALNEIKKDTHND